MLNLVTSFYLIVALASSDLQLSRQYVRSQQRYLVRQWHAWIQSRSRFNSQSSALCQQRGDRVLLRLRHTAAKISRPTVLVVGGSARTFALLAAATRPLRRICGSEELRQGRTRRRRHRHRILRNSSRLWPGLSSRYGNPQHFCHVSSEKLTFRK